MQPGLIANTLPYVVLAGVGVSILVAVVLLYNLLRDLRRGPDDTVARLERLEKIVREDLNQIDVMVIQAHNGLDGSKQDLILSDLTRVVYDIDSQVSEMNEILSQTRDSLSANRQVGLGKRIAKLGINIGVAEKHAKSIQEKIDGILAGEGKSVGSTSGLANG